MWLACCLPSITHVGFVNPFTLCAIYAIPNLRSATYVRIYITTNCIAAKILQQSNFGIGKFPDHLFALVWERDYLRLSWPAQILSMCQCVLQSFRFGILAHSYLCRSTGNITLHCFCMLVKNFHQKGCEFELYTRRDWVHAISHEPSCQSTACMVTSTEQYISLTATVTHRAVTLPAWSEHE